MKKKGKQLLSLLLSAVMVFTLLPSLTLTALAAAPIVSSVTPSGTDADISGSIVITFSEAVDINTAGTVSLDGGNTSLTGGKLSSDATVYTVPYSALNYATTYTVTISGFADTSGNPMTADSSHSFTTSPSVAPAGSGMESDPYIINTLAELIAVTDNPGANYKLNADITADTPLTSALCSKTVPFTGNFDGNGKSISVNISDTTNGYLGLFAYIGKGGSVSNLTVTGSVTGSAGTLYIGALAGENDGEIDNCISNATVTANGSIMNNVGGLVGYSIGNITSSSAGGSVTAGGAAVAGGLVGVNYNTTSGGAVTSAAKIENCSASADVTATTASSDAGGLVGQNTTSDTTTLKDTFYNITDCSASGRVSATAGSVGGLIGFGRVVSIKNSTASGDVTASGQGSFAGGLIGYNKGNAKITACHSSGRVTNTDGSGKTAYTGGFVGYLYSGQADNCYSTGDVSVSSCSVNSSAVGGFVGLLKAGASNYCFSSGDITADSISNASTYLGGFAGTVNSGVVLNYVYSTGNIVTSNATVDSPCGGLIGYMNGGTDGMVSNAYIGGNASSGAKCGGLTGKYGSGSFTNCYWDKSKNSKSDGSSAAEYGTGLTAAQMTGSSALTSMTGFDTSSWVVTANEAFVFYYPQLQKFSGDTKTSADSLASVSWAVPTDISVTVTPSSPTIAKGLSTQFTATVTGNNNPDKRVVWTISGQTSTNTTISSTGLLKIANDESASSLTVTATSTFDSSAFGKAAVTVSTSTDFGGGDGSSGNPFIITKLDQLKAVSNYPSSCFKLTEDISGLTAPLFSSTSPFSGNFNGNGKSIGLDITDSTNGYLGAFAYIGSGGYVSNLTVTGSVTGSAATLYIGGLAAYNQGEINSCSSSVTVTANGSNMNYAGGLVGYNTGTIAYSSAGESVTANGKANAGGLVGYSNSADPSVEATKAVLDNCSAAGAVTVNSANSFAGGLAGTNDTGTGSELSTPVYNITNCSATGNVTANGASSTVGGLVGYGRVASASNCFASGNVTAGKACNAGGFWGWTKVSVHIADSHSSGSVTNTDCSGGNTFTGGFVGRFESGQTDNCYATGKVSIASCSGNNSCAGGFIGLCGTGTSKNCFASGDVSADSVSNKNTNLGGLIGNVLTNATISNVYATGDVTFTNNGTDCPCGGLLGSIAAGTVSGAYYGGVASSGLWGGAVVGRYVTGTFTNCYWNKSKNTKSGVSAEMKEVTGLSADQMTGSSALTNMSGLDASAWAAKANADPVWYSPQLTVFSEGSDDTIKSDSLNSVKTGSVSEFTSGSGMSGDPYVISTLSELNTAKNYPSAYFKLGADISGLSSPLFSDAIPFTGHFDGNSKTITLNISDTADTYVGLFGCIGSGATVTNLKLAGTVSATLSGKSSTLYIGALAGSSAGTVTGCVSSANVTATNSCMNHIGGLLGYNTGSVSGSSASGAVTANGKANIGGLIGTDYSINDASDKGNLTDPAPVDNCSASGVVRSNATDSKAGGLIGSNTTAAGNTLASAAYVVTNSFASGEVFDMPGSGYAGGLIGYNQVVSVKNCYSTGNVNGTFNSNIGGFIGFSTGEATISDCHAKGTVTDASVSQDANIGGFIGKLNSGMIQKSYETGNVSILSSSAPYSYIGGMVGLLYSGTIDSCFASGDITASNVTSPNFLNPYIGGFVGVVSGKESVFATISNSYASGDVTLTPMLYGSHLGGFVGFNGYGSYTAVYAMGTVKGGCGFMGGFDGEGTNSCTGVYWNNSKNGGGTGWQRLSISGTGLTSDEMSGTAAMTALDFSTVWTTKANDASHSYAPQLKVFANSSDSTIAADSLSSVELASDSTVKLDLSFNPSWNGTMAKWGCVGYAGGYDIALYKDDKNIKEVSVNSEQFSYDFSSDIVKNGNGAYRFTVKAKGTVEGGITYTDGEVSTPYSPYSYIAPLSAPGNLKWDSGTPAKATWDTVEGAVSYKVQLCKGGVASGSAVTGITSTNYDFTSIITEPGSYTFTVTAIGDGTSHSDSPVSSNTAAYVFTKTLGTPGNLQWGTGTPAKATWDAVVGAVSYTVQIYKGGLASGSAVTGISNNYYDFTSKITEPGSYTFAVTAVGDGTYYMTGSASSQSAAYLKTATLGVPANLKWDTGIPAKATWDAVSNVSSYTVQLCKGGKAIGDAISGITGNFYDFSSALTEPGSYTFTVMAVGDGNVYLNSGASSDSPAKIKTQTLSTPVNLKWDPDAQGKATWDAVNNTVSYTVLLYKGGKASGDAITGITGNSYDFTSAITESGSYSFSVTAIGDGTIYLNSDTSTPSASSNFEANSTLSVKTSSFNKCAGSSGNSDVSVGLTFNGNTLKSICNGSGELQSGTDYMLSDTTVTINKNYLATLLNGEATLTFKFSAGSDQTLKITVSDSTTILIKVIAPSAITGLANGTEKTASSLGLPSTVTLETSNGNISTSVAWDLAACLYDVKSSSSQTFTVNGKVTLPDGINNADNIPLTVCVSITVNQVYSPGSSGGKSHSPSYQATITENNGTSQKLSATTNGSSVFTTIGMQQNNEIRNGGRLELNMPVVPNASSYGVNVLVSSLSSDAKGVLNMDSALGSISIPTDMFSSLSGETDKEAIITISRGETSSLPDDIQKKIGDRAVIQLTVLLGGSQYKWNNPNAAVTVSIPYKPTAEELKNPGCIVIWYIDGSGKAICVPSGHYDAKTGTVTFTTTHFSQYAVAYNAVSFFDVSSSSWYKDYVSYLSARNIVGGTGGGQFRPDAGITRAEFLTILARMSGDDLSGYASSAFSDVLADSWYSKSVQWAYKAGIASGYNGEFSPNASITREQMAAMLYRYGVYKGTASNTEGMSVREFSDYDSISSWAQAPIQWALNNGILSGNTDGGFAPHSSATRAEAAKMLAILLQGMVK